MRTNFLITGATGFVGSCLVRELIAMKKHVSIVTRQKTLNWRLKDLTSQLSIYECDLRSPSINQIINKVKPTYIFHLAAYGTLPDENDVETMIDVNIKGTINLIDALKNHKFKLFINTGTSSEYGISSTPMKETDTPRPINDYGSAKAATTLFCCKEAIRKNLPLVTFRLFSPYGYYEDKSRLIPLVVLGALKNKPLELSSSANVRDFIFIEDIIRVYLKASEKKLKPGEIFNIGTGQQHSILEVVNTVMRITNSKSKIVWGKVKKQVRQLESDRWLADITKAKTILKWSPRYDLENGIFKTIEWFKLNQNLYG